MEKKEVKKTIHNYKKWKKQNKKNLKKILKSKKSNSSELLELIEYNLRKTHEFYKFGYNQISFDSDDEFIVKPIEDCLLLLEQLNDAKDDIETSKLLYFRIFEIIGENIIYW